MPTEESTSDRSRRAALRAGSVSLTGVLAGCIRPLLEDGENVSTSGGTGEQVPSSDSGSGPSVISGWEAFYDNPGPLEEDDGTIIATDRRGTDSAMVVAHELDSGERTWEFSTEDGVDQWALSTGHGNVYATATIGGTLHRTYVIERGSGTLAGTADLEVPGSTEDRIYEPHPAVITSDRAVVAAGRWNNDVATRIQGIDAARSEAVWTTEGSGLLYRGGIAYEDRAYLAAAAGLVRVDPADGSRTEFEQSIRPSPNGRPVRQSDVAYVLGRSSSGTRTLFAMRLPDGEQLWSYDTGSETFSSSEYDGPAVLPDGGAVVPVSGTVYALEADGTERWTADIDGDTGIRPFVVGSTVVILRGDGLVGYDVETGSTAFEYETVSEPQAATTDGEHLVCSLTDSVTRFEIDHE
jgi:outer membrane protein assembly factor BamB